MSSRLRTFATSCAAAFLIATPASATARHVTIAKGAQGWQLQVDGRPFFIKGVGCNKAQGDSGEDYLSMARDMGANAVRTWGDAPRSYLDKAEENGLMVNLGIWINPIRGDTTESYADAGHREGLKSLILAYVHEMKDHPALLSWNMGNEAFNFTDNEDEKKALGKFLEDIIVAVHQEDPDHPVVYASADIHDLPDLKAYVPDLDIVGINTYGSLSAAFNWVSRNGYDKPIIATEFGPLGAWDVSKDKNDMPFDPPDQLKAANYESLWRQIETAKGVCLGGFAFVLGDPRNQDSLTWLNINFGPMRREAFGILYKAYTGKKLEYSAPKISEFVVDNSTGVSRGALVQVKVSASAPSDEKLHYAYFMTGIVSDPLMIEPPKYYPLEPEETSPGTARFHVPEDPNIYRVYAAVSDEHDNVAIADRSLRVLPQ